MPEKYRKRTIQKAKEIEAVEEQLEQAKAWKWGNMDEMLGKKLNDWKHTTIDKKKTQVVTHIVGDHTREQHSHDQKMLQMEDALKKAKEEKTLFATKEK